MSEDGRLIILPQCILPCIEGLFPEPHNTSVIELLFIFATWHALAKLHIHTDTSLRLLDTATTALGNALRYFVRVTCPEFNTFETSSEYTKRQRQQAAAASATLNAAPPSTGRQRRTFSLKTIKLHFLGDYVSCIKMFGTTDNYNSALVCQGLTFLTVETDYGQGENCHHQVKLNCQSRSNNKETAQQLGEMDYIDFQVRRIADDLRRAGIPVPGNVPTPATDEPQVETDFTIARGHKSTIYLPHWIHDNRNDPALTVSLFIVVIARAHVRFCN